VTVVELIQTVLKTIGGPGSLGFMALCLALGLILTRFGPRARRWGRGWLLLVLASYIVLGLPFVANRIARSLPPPQPNADLGALHRHLPDALVVLDGDNRLGRINEARKIFSATSPRWVVVSGSQWMVDQIIEAGVPADRVIADLSPSTTREQILRLPAVLQGRGVTRIILIASRLQMTRVGALAEANGLSASLAPSRIDDEPPTSGVRVLVPTYIALRVSRDAIYEHAAIAYYRYRRWIR
jgi:uncharacterized SAM-binding protein YcdF (DUF218 family)